MVTLAKKDSVATRRRAFRILQDRTLVKKLFDEIGPRFEGREGGYTRVLKRAVFRRGDGSPTALLSFTELSEAARPSASAKKEKKKKPAKGEKK
jgi:large subunit ribosomal protein L17